MAGNQRSYANTLGYGDLTNGQTQFVDIMEMVNEHVAKWHRRQRHT